MSATLLIGTEKGLWVARSDAKRATWKVEGPHFKGWKVTAGARTPSGKWLVATAKWSVLVDSFYQVMPFGTGGRRGSVGIGPNRMNLWTLGASVQGHCDYLKQRFPGVNPLQVVLAFDVRPDGTTTNRRDFGVLGGDDGGDGMAIDSEGRLYVTGNRGVHVLSPRGEYLGMIPTPRRPITIAFSGPDKNLLYAPSMGAVGPDGKAWTTPELIRNTAMTIYRMPLLARGYLGRPK